MFVNVFNWTFQVKTLRHDVESKNKDIEELHQEKVRIKQMVVSLESSLGDQKQLTEGFEKRLEVVNATAVDLQGQLDTQTSAMQSLEAENSLKTSEIATKEEEIAKTKLEVARTGRELEDAKKKIIVAEKAKEELQNDKTRYTYYQTLAG